MQVARDGGAGIDGAAPVLVTMRWRLRDRTWIWIAGAVAALAAAIGATIALTRYRERRLAICADELRRVVEERTRELSASNAELEAFSCSVSHDLRVPLRHAAGFAALLRSELGSRIALGEAAADYLRVIEGATSQMSALIDALLRLSQAGRVRTNPQPVSLPALVAAVSAACGGGGP